LPSQHLARADLEKALQLKPLGSKPINQEIKAALAELEQAEAAAKGSAAPPAQAQ
jgi:hypothetical protein